MFKHLKISATGILMLLVALTGAAKKTEFSDILPRYSAIVAGVDFVALCDTPQGALTFKELENIIPEKLNHVTGAFFACDAAGRRISLLLPFSEPVNITEFDGCAGIKLTDSGKKLSSKVYFINFVPDERKPVRVTQLKPELLSIYASYHRHDPFAPDHSGIAPEIKKLIPKRKNILVWIVGMPSFTDKILCDIQYFDLTLEKDISDRLLMHGKVICKDQFKAMLIANILPVVLSFFLNEEYCVAPETTLNAVKALNIRQDNNVLRFSCTEPEKSLQLLREIIVNQLPVVRHATGGGK